MTHHAVEDIAVMRCLPNMAVLSPYSALNIVESIKGIYESGTPSYLRLSRTSNDTLLNQERGVIRGSSKGRVIILATGGRIVENALESSRRLTKLKIVADVVAITTIKPFEYQALSALAKEAPALDAIITIEEHSKIGGLGSAVAEVLTGMRQHPPLVRLGTDDCYPTTAMSYEELLKANHLDVGGIVQEVLDALQ